MIDSITRNEIERFYDEKIKANRNTINRREKEIKKEVEEKINNDKIYKNINNLFDELNEKYPKLRFNLDCSLYAYGSDFEFEEDETIKSCNENIERLRNKKSRILLTLSNNSKTLKNYKNALDEFYKERNF